MSRWHKAGCTRPDVIVEADSHTPLCTACNTSPSIENLTPPRTSKSNISTLATIVKGPLQDLNLHWPPCVPYHSSQPVVLTPKPYVSNLTEDVAITSNYASPTIYKRLQPDEFRLLRLCPTERKDGPLHLNLHQYRHENCPEYETVSYTWGGEDGNSTLCKPIYIGPYWDILFQTHNCWNMLRLLRPAEGIRTLWVDAVCIDQNDLVDKENQVAKMGRIYEEGSRVIVYLGSDIVSNLLPCQYPPRHRLHLLHSISGANLQEILKRRYFSRVWVIQELILSRQILLRIGGNEFWADQVAVKNLSNVDRQWNWDSTPAPLAWASKATDSRDKVFGILGLIEGSRFTLHPDYSIGTRHVFIGIFAHCLLNLKDTRILAHAAGIGAWGDFPSWIPNWRSTIPPTNFETGFDVKVSSRNSDYPSTWTGSWMRNVERKNEGHGDMQFMSLFVSDSLSILKNERGNASATPKKPYKWNSGASIDASTGGLSVNLVHLLRFRQGPSLIDMFGNTRVYAFRGSERISMYIVVSNIELDSCINLDRDHLFLLIAGNNSGKQSYKGSVYLILRQLDPPRRFHLVCCCEQLYFGFSPYPNSGLLQLSYIRQSSYFQLLKIRSLCGSKLILSRPPFLEVFIREDQLETTFPVLQGLLNEERDARPDFLETYLHYMKRFSAEVEEHESGCQWIQLKLPPKVWGSVLWGNEEFVSLWHSWAWEGEQWYRFSDRVPNSLQTKMQALFGTQSNKFLYVRVKAHSLRSRLQKARLVSSLRRLNVCNRLRSEQEEEFSILGRLDRWEENNMASPDLPPDFYHLQDVYGFDGSTYQVTIV